jgi:hypothetical protein
VTLAKERAVQRWEYQTWLVGFPGRYFHRGGVVRTIDGVRLESALPLPSTLQAAGADGWDLVGVAAGDADLAYAFKRPKGTAPQWEYQTWSAFHAGDQAQEGGLLNAIDGQMLKSSPRLPAALRQAGEEGWELVSVARDGGAFVYTFKRPKE